MFLEVQGSKISHPSLWIKEGEPRAKMESMQYPPLRVHKHTHTTNTKDSHTGHIPALHMCRASLMIVQTVASVI